MNTLRKVQQFIEQNQLFDFEDRILAGVSGGADSVVMLHILLKLGYKCIVAHCNFHLRGKESNRDEMFVKNLAEEYNLIFKKINFDTIGFAKSNKISIEMAARELRYSWFRKIAAETNCKAIAVAHQSDDSIETMLLNLIRGTGLKGLTGIDAKNGNIVRPLLSINREEVEKYAQKFDLKYVTDSTNAENNYNRNKIRNIILPQMASLNPSVNQSLEGNIKRLKGAWKIYSDKIEEIKKEVVQTKNGQLYIEIEKLKKQPHFHTVLYELLYPYQFNAEVIHSIALSLDKQPGLRFYSDSHRLLKDRDFLIIDKNEEESPFEYIIEKTDSRISFPINLTISIFEKEEHFTPSKIKTKIHIDADEVTFPLFLRKWKKGDSFFPFGMTNSKKLSDFFIDEKFTRNQKEETWLIISESKILWVVGHRLDNRFRVKKETKNILEITLI